jgi:Tol biopolymer transport system component
MRVRHGSLTLIATVLAAVFGPTLHAQIPARLGSGAAGIESREVILFVAASKHRRWEIDRINADGSGHVRLTGFGRGTFTAAWSPDATQIAFGRGTHMFVMNADGTERRMIADGLVRRGAGIADLAWSPDESQVAFVSGPERRPYIAIANVET